VKNARHFWIRTKKLKPNGGLRRILLSLRVESIRDGCEVVTSTHPSCLISSGSDAKNLLELFVNNK
jgi:hypothetical protein